MFFLASLDIREGDENIVTCNNFNGFIESEEFWKKNQINCKIEIKNRNTNLRNLMLCSAEKRRVELRFWCLTRQADLCLCVAVFFLTLSSSQIFVCGKAFLMVTRGCYLILLSFTGIIQHPEKSVNNSICQENYVSTFSHLICNHFSRKVVLQSQFFFQVSC